MNVEVVVATAALTVSIAALGASSMLSWRQLRSLRTANHLPVAIELLTRDMGKERFQAQERYLIETLAEVEPGTAVSHLPERLRDAAYTVSSFYDSMGILVAYGCVEERLVLSTINFRIRRIWGAMEAHIHAERRLRGALYLDYLEDLAYRANHADPAVLRDQLGLHRMPEPARPSPEGRGHSPAAASPPESRR